ncbi:MAG: flagellar basal body P-ring protein FlgI [Firmicutes bacterium]|nr:flagellar basal body P-ring protein FlgI [Bacillota bacterium]
MNRSGVYVISVVIIMLLVSSFAPCLAYDEHMVNVRIKDLVTIYGSNENQLIGYGLVTGLAGTGDRTKTLTSQMINNMFANMGITLPESEVAKLQTKNAAVVMITANLPASFRSGDNIDVTVSSMGDATSLEGGVLLFSTLKAADGKVYASAQGPLMVGYGGQTRGGAGKKSLVGIIPNGAIISRNMDSNIVRNGTLTLALRSPDFNTAERVSKAINAKFGDIAKPRDNRIITVDVSGVSEDPVSFMSRIGELTVVPDNIARVVVNERTGTVIMGGNVKILPVAISHGTLSLNVGGNQSNQEPQMTPNPDNPNPGGKDQQGDSNYQLQGRQKTVVRLGGDSTVKDVVDVLNYLEVTPKDLITILQALKRAGALQAELEIQ